MRRFFRGAGRGGRRLGAVLAVSLLAGLTGLVAAVPAAPPASAQSTSGYWLVGGDGGIFSYGSGLSFYGSTGSIPLNQPIVGMAPTASGRGYWLVASDGGIFAFGDAHFLGSMGGKPLNQPIVGMAATRSGKGYWLVASDGGIFAFGDAPFFGSTGGIKLNKPIVDIVPTPSGRGYWMAASDGGIFAFGDAGFFGSTGGINLVKRIQAIAATPSGRGYWLVAGDGGVFSFGDAKFYGSAPGSDEKRVVDIAPSATGAGYYLTASNGAVFAYGDAKWFGGAQDLHLAHGIISMAAVAVGAPPVTVPDTINVDEDNAATADVLANDTDPGGGTLTVTDVSQPAHGTATFAIGTVGYRPAPNFNGTDSFTYTVVDSQGNTAVGTVNVFVRSIDDLPKAVADSFTVPLGVQTPLDVLSNDSLFEGFAANGPITFVTQPSQGHIDVSANRQTLLYTSPAKKGGPFTFSYIVTDAHGHNSTASVTITVTGDLVPNAPNVDVSCGASPCETDVSKAAGFSLGDAGVLSMVGEDGQHSVQTADGTFNRTDSTISFTPANGSVTSASVHYRILDKDASGKDQPAEGIVTFHYGNGAPTAQAGADNAPLAVGSPASWLLVGTDPDHDPLTFQLVSASYNDGSQTVDAMGLFTLDQDGHLHFSGGSAGSWTVMFTVADDHGHTSAPAAFTFQTQ